MRRPDRRIGAVNEARTARVRRELPTGRSVADADFGHPDVAKAIVRWGDEGR